MNVRIVASLRIAVLAGAEALAFDACTVFGVFLDRATGQPLPGAEVFLINVDKNTSRRTLTNDKGEYVFDLVYPRGIHRIIATLRGVSAPRNSSASR